MQKKKKKKKKKKIKVILRFQVQWAFLLSVIFWLQHALGQRKVSFVNSFVWIQSILMYTKFYQNIPYG